MRLISSPYFIAPSRRGFTLVELLVVMAISALLVTVSVSALPGVLGSGTMNQAVSDLSSAMTKAHADALARNTYVWLEFQYDNTNQRMIVTTYYSLDGTGKNVSTSNLQPAEKTFFIKNVNLSDKVLSITSSDGDSRPSQNVAYTPSAGSWLIYNSTGEVQMPINDSLSAIPQFDATQAIQQWYEVGIVPLHGSGSNVAAIQVSGLTGQVAIYRPGL